MKRVLKWLLGLILFLVVLGGAFFVHVWYFKPASINWFYGRVFAKFAVDSPELLSNMRILPPMLDFYSNKLDDASDAHVQQVAAMIKEDLDVLHSYDRKGMTGDAALSYDVLDFFLATQVEGDRFRYHDYPINQMFGEQSTLPNFMASTHQVTTKNEGERYVERLKMFPVKLGQVLDGVKLRESKGIVPPQFTVEEVIEQMTKFIAKPAKEHMLYTSFKEKLDKIPAGDMDSATREKLLADVAAAIDGSVYPTYKKLIEYYTGLLPKAQGNFGVWHLPDGPAFYAWCVRQHTTTDFTPEQVHQMGLEEVARISAEMDEILKSKGLVDGTIGDRVRTLSKDPSQLYPDNDEGRAQILKDYQAILDDINAKLDKAFDVRPKLGVTVKRVPEFSQATAPGAYYEPGSFDGTRPGIFYANLRTIGETPKLGMHTLAYHEGIPGHHFQIAVAQDLKGVPFFRRVLNFTAYAEGWALYAERLAWELGFENDPLDNLGRLRDEMMRAVRLVVDTGIHSKQWTREQAIQYMYDNTGMLQTDVKSEIERYFVAPGQALGYKVGMLKILQLREKARKELGDKFDLRKFHNEVLTHGALPLVLLERVIDDWIAKTKAG